MIATLIGGMAAPAQDAGGSIAVQGLLCDSAAADTSDCNYTDEIFGGDIMLAGPGGIILTLDDGESHAVSHVWNGVPYGIYYLQALGADPPGYRLERIDGAVIVDTGVEAVVVSADNSAASVNLIYVPAG